MGHFSLKIGFNKRLHSVHLALHDGEVFTFVIDIALVPAIDSNIMADDHDIVEHSSSSVCRETDFNFALTHLSFRTRDFSVVVLKLDL